jgi:hypothetical protein
MSLALTNSRGSFLNWRLAVKGIQNARMSLGVVLRRFDMIFSENGSKSAGNLPIKPSRPLKIGVFGGLVQHIRVVGQPIKRHVTVKAPQGIS